MADPKSEFNIVEDSEFNVVEPGAEFNVIEDKPYTQPEESFHIPSELVSTPAHIGGDPLLDVPLSKEAPTYGPGEYGKSIVNRVTSMGNQALEFGSKVTDLIAGSSSQENREAPNVIQRVQQEGVRGLLHKPATNPELSTAPIVGLRTLGWGLNKFQEHVGKHVSAGLVNVLMGNRTEKIDNPQDVLINAGVHQGPRAPPALTDIRGKTPTEMMLRQALTFWAGNDFALNEEEALQAINQLNQDPIVLGGLMMMADQVGSLPMFFFNPGAKAAALERQALLKGAKYADKPAKEIVKGLAGIEARQGAKVGALQGGIQGAKDAQLEGGDFNKSVAVGTFAGGVLGRVIGGLAGRAGAKSAVLAERNKNLTAIGLPPETWEQFVKEANEAAGLVEQSVSPELQVKLAAAEKEAQKAAQPYFAAPSKKTEFKTAGKLPTYVSPSLDPEGNLWLDGYTVNWQEKSVKQTSAYKIKRQDWVKYNESTKLQNQQGMFTGDVAPFNQHVSKKDPAAFNKLLEEMKYHSGREAPPDTMRGTPNYMAPETIEQPDAIRAAAKTKQFLRRPKEELGGNQTVPEGVVKPASPELPVEMSDTFVNPRSHVVVSNKNGDLIDIPVSDMLPNHPDKSIVFEGDFVQLPGGKTGLVRKTNKDNTITVELPGGRKVVVNASQVAPSVDPAAIAASKNFMKSQASAVPNKPKDLLKLGRLDLQRVMAAYDVDITEASRMLAEMQIAGQVKHDGKGNFYPNKFVPTFGSGTPPVSPGMLVYYDVDPLTFNGKEGILRGPDPKKKGNYLLEIGVEDSLGPIVDVDTGARQGPVTQKQATQGAAIGVPAEQVFNKTKTISVDPARMRSVMPQLWGNAKLSNLPEQYGMTKPMPPGVMLASTVTQNQIAQYVKLAEKLNRPGLLGRIADKAKQQLFNEAFTGPPEARKLNQSLFAQKALLAAQKQNYTEYLTGGVHGVLSKHDSALQKILKTRQAGGQAVTKQQQDVANYFAQHPELEVEVGQTIQGTLDSIKRNQEFLAAAGFDSIQQNEAARALGLQDEYETALYLRNMMGREKYQEFAKKHLPEEYERAIKLIIQREPGKSWQTAQSDFLDLLDVNKDLELSELASKGSADAKKNLIARKQMQKEITDILGKVESAALGLAHSKAISDTLVSRVKQWNVISDSAYWSPGPRADLGAGGGIPVPNHPIFGKAAGGRVHESFKPLLEVKKLDSDTNGLARTLGAYWKFNVVPAGGFTPWVNNVMRNWKGMVFSGGLETPADFQTFFEAAQMMLDYKRNPLKFGPNNQFLEAMQNGAVSTGFAANEINKVKTVNRILEAVRQGKGSKADVWEMLDGVKDSMVSSAQDVGAAYDTIDRLFKFTAYLNLKRKFVSMGYSQNDAAALATMRINDSFPNYELVGPLVEKMRKGSVFAVAPFLTSKAEDMRVNAKMAVRLSNMASSDPLARQDAQQLAIRLAGATAVLGGALKLNNEIGKVNGITDSDRNRALDETKLQSQAFRPGRFVLPVKDKEGRIQIGDTTSWDDTLMMMRIHPFDMDTAGGVTAAVIRNNLAEVFGTETLPGIEIDQAFTMAAGLHPLTKRPDLTPRPGEFGITPFLSYLAQHGGVPGFVNRIQSVRDKGEKNPNPRVSIQQELWNQDQQDAKLFGMPFAGPVSLGAGSPTTMGRIREMQQSSNEMKKQQKQVTNQNLNKPDEAKRLIKAKVDERMRIYNEVKNRGQ